MLVDDMGGNGRALEALESAVKDVNYENVSFLSIVEMVYHNLKRNFAECISLAQHLIPVLRVILTRTFLYATQPIPGTNILPDQLSRLGLVKFVKVSEEGNIGTLICPYIWLWLMANESKENILTHLNFKYYNENQAKEDQIIPPGYEYWIHFEHFVSSFRVIKSHIFEKNKQIKLEKIHAGAKHNFGTAAINNIPLEKTVHRENTKSQDYSVNKKLICKSHDDYGDRKEIDLDNVSACIINGTSSSYGNSFCPIHFIDSSQQLHIESHQCKYLKSNTVNQEMFDEEYRKTTSSDDVFILYTRGFSNIKNLPPLSAIVDLDCWNSYFGPFAGRAFMLTHNEPLNANDAKFFELTSVNRISEKCGRILMSKRPFKDLEDCHQKTKIPRNILNNLQFK
ncbi:hypothetical protein RclHR1_00060031 [Rhizophagus clarus]|uniref:Uncharacterized protein n=1 Tax=Rhizophagus clarus TaxID=94130 RepID=A0A2Z6RPS6_9GLOM|nr:hypothetical protein RclHR1_00060031 [Rhizophagus clarus]